VPILLPAALLAYAAVALVHGWWLSALIAPLVAWLLWRRHRRARFTAYVFFSVLTARALLVASWPLALFALGAIGALQLPAARRAWPRLTRGRPLR
jgi:CDP-diglyceride synthetase